MKKVFDVFKTAGPEKKPGLVLYNARSSNQEKKFNFRFEIAATRRVGRTLPYRG